MWFINWFRYCTKKNVSGGCIILLLLISWQKIYCFIYCFGRLLQISTLSATHATQHTNTHMAGKTSPPPGHAHAWDPVNLGRVRKQIRRRELEGEHARPKHYRYATFLLLLRCQRAAPSSPRCPRLEGLSTKPQVQVGRRKRAPPNAYRIFLA